MMKLKRKIGKQLLSGILTFSMVLSSAVTSYAYTADTKILPSDVTAPADGCVFVGVKGDYIAEAQKALDRINAIRLEACREGVPNPSNPSQKLTEADYVPIQWSASLEAVARLRAAEASLVVGHTRPNGNSCFSISASDVWDSGEVLAWNWSSSMVSGIEQWYGEKSGWVKQTPDVVTGHYTQMIDPENTHVGLGCMVTDNGIYKNTTCGRFGVDSEGVNVDTTMAPAVKDCIQVIEIQRSALTGTTLEKISKGSIDKLEIGDTVSYELMTGTNLEGDKAKALVMGNIKWTSSNSKVATVDAYGKVTGIGVGTVKITATSDSGMTASVSLTFKDSKSVSKVKSLKAKAGSKKLTITWKKVFGAAGYQLQVSTKSNFKGAKTVKISKSKKQYVAKKLKAKKKYYVRIRAYKTYKDAKGKTKKAYGKWVKVSKKTK